MSLLDLFRINIPDQETTDLIASQYNGYIHFKIYVTDYGVMAEPDGHYSKSGYCQHYEYRELGDRIANAIGRALKNFPHDTKYSWS